MAVIYMLKEAESETLSVLEFLLSNATRTKVQSWPSAWSLISKLVHTKKVSCEGEKIESNEFMKLDADLHSVICNKNREEDDMQVNQLMNHLKWTQASIDIVEEELK
ncbi:uncharacterized protein Fot_50835 [Forsythia ovata]|uniref:Uncharacterized protein n=1 Tax=Forsythia ovata TaxID=205694 RepID=A0ABD1Q074_9LAMI